MRHSTLICTASVLALAGCPGLDLGEAPFFCHNGNPECPEGYTCERVDGRDICVKEGSQPPSLTDGAVPDAPEGEGLPPIPDGPLPPLDGKPTVDLPPTPGTVIVSELMANPKAVTDTDGEWLELFNPGGTPVDINGWTLRDKGTSPDTHVIAAGGPLTVPAKGYLLIGRSTDKVLNGGVNVVYAYSSFYLANTEDEVELVDTTGKVVESFSYSAAAGFTIPDGASLSLKSPGADKNNPANWCAEQSPWPGSKGDKGTPGANPGC